MEETDFIINKDNIASLLERIAINTFNPSSHSFQTSQDVTWPEKEQDLNQVSSVSSTIIQFLVPLLFANTPQASQSFVWDNEVSLNVLIYLVKHQCIPILSVIEAVLQTARNGSSPQIQPLVVSDALLQTISDLILWPDLQISENATNTLVALTLYFNGHGGDVTWNQQLITSMIAQIDAIRRECETQEQSTAINPVVFSTRIIRLASTLIRCIRIEKDPSSEPLSYYVVQSGLLDLLFVEPFSNIKLLDTQDVLSRLTLLDEMDSIVGYDHNILSWMLSNPVLLTLFSLLGYVSTIDTHLLYMAPPCITQTTVESDWSQFWHQNQDQTQRKVIQGGEEERGLVLSILSHIFHQVFQSMIPQIPLEPNKLVLWSGFHQAISHFISSFRFQRRQPNQEAQRLAFMDVMVSYVTTHPYILSCFLDTFEARSNQQQEEGPFDLLWDAWLNLRHVSVPLKAAMLNAISIVLEKESIDFEIRWRFSRCIGQIHGTAHGGIVFVDMCRTSPSVEVRLGAYRCLHAVSRETFVVKALLHDSQLGFFEFISRQETEKETKEAKHVLRSILLQNPVTKMMLSETRYEQLAKMVQSGPFSKSTFLLSDPLVE